MIRPRHAKSIPPGPVLELELRIEVVAAEIVTFGSRLAARAAI
jgi:hypothetical protein